MTSINKIETTQLLIKGLIQGVGFRPFIYRIANKHQLKGIVYNQNNGVIILVQGKIAQIDEFVESVKTQAPIAASIDNIEREFVFDKMFSSFEIIKSKKIDSSITQVSPDIAVCADCLNDTKKQKHRINYPFTNCTNCGPRYSIVENIPYDRELTSMKKFKMCPECEKEYGDISDRRFHAQPVACNNCGPIYSLHTKNGVLTSIEEILNKLNLIIRDGGTISIKGLGGFHLACDAFNSNAVEKLRQIKKRDGKPFALMFNSIDSAKKYTNINQEEEQILCSWQRPIVLAKSIFKFPAGIAGKLSTMGIFLPYLPFHYQLFEGKERNSMMKFLTKQAAGFHQLLPKSQKNPQLRKRKLKLIFLPVILAA